MESGSICSGYSDVGLLYKHGSNQIDFSTKARALFVRVAAKKYGGYPSNRSIKAAVVLHASVMNL